MATKITKKEQAELDRIAALDAEATSAFAPIASKVSKAASAYVALEKKATRVRVELGNVASLMMTALSVPTFPEADREGAILRHLATLGCKGFTYSTIASWGKAFHTWKVLPPEVRDAFPVYSLIDLSRIPTDPEHETGGRVNVALASLAAGNETDDEHRAFIRDARRKASGWTPPKGPSLEDQAKAIADKAGSTPPVLTPNPDGMFELSHEDLVAAVMYGVSIRATGGDRDLRAYKTVVRNAFPESATDVAPTVELTDVEAADLDLAV